MSRIETEHFRHRGRRRRPSDRPASRRQAEEAQVFTITIKDHKFDPAEVRVPAGKPVILVVKNADATAEEFESSTLKVEKIIPGGQQGTVRLRPLAVGSYAFIGEFHSDTANGRVIAE